MYLFKLFQRRKLKKNLS
jgi:hypothetical protein